MAKVQLDLEGDIGKAVTKYKELYKTLTGDTVTKPDIVNMYLAKGMDKIEGDIEEMERKIKEIEKLKKPEL